MSSAATNAARKKATAHQPERLLEGARMVTLQVSPWSERARFALKVAGLLDHVSIVDYTPMVDEPWLRYLLGVWSPS